jgi:hypothetical protein
LGGLSQSNRNRGLHPAGRRRSWPVLRRSGSTGFMSFTHALRQSSCSRSSAVGRPRPMHSFFLSLHDDLRAPEFAAQSGVVAVEMLNLPCLRIGLRSALLRPQCFGAWRRPTDQAGEENLRTDGIDEDFSMTTISESCLVAQSTRGRYLDSHSHVGGRTNDWTVFKVRIQGS